MTPEQIKNAERAFQIVDGNSLPASPEFLTLDQWRTRDLPPLDHLLGSVFHTTARILLAAATGLGKTNLSLALGMRIAAGV